MRPVTVKRFPTSVLVSLVLAVLLSVYCLLLSISITNFMSNLKHALIIELLWTQSRRHWGLWYDQPTNKTPSPQIEIWNTINQWSFCQFLECQAPLHKRKAPLLKTFWTVHWNINESIQSYIKQPVSLLGFNTAQSWKSLLWPSCGKWNGQHIAAILVASSTILAQHGLCLTSETMRLHKCSEISKINSVTATELLWWRSQSRSIWPMRSIKVCKEAIFRFAISSLKTH